MIRTNPFLATKLTFGPDGSIWALGRNLTAGDAMQDYDVFERYSAAGALLGRFVPRSTFKIRTSPDESGGVGGSTFLSASADKILAYIASTKEWFEFDPGGQLVARWDIPLPVVRPELGSRGTRPVWGVGVTRSGSVYMRLGGNGDALYRLYREKRRLEPIAATLGPTQIGRLYGSDGDQLVFEEPGSNSLLWYLGEALAN